MQVKDAQAILLRPVGRNRQNHTQANDRLEGQQGQGYPPAFKSGRDTGPQGANREQ